MKLHVPAHLLLQVISLASFLTAGSSAELPGAGPISALGMYDLHEKNPIIVKLPKALKEISGVTMTADGRMFAHNDEVGRIYEIDYSLGVIIKQFSIGSMTVLGDFEDITIVGDRFFLLSSDGRLYEVREGKNAEHVKYKSYRTGLSVRNNVEGLCYDPDTNSLLLACKNYPGEGYEHTRTVYSFSLSSMTMAKDPRFVVSLKTIKREFGLADFRPSGIARHPKTGTFFLLDSRGLSILELSPKGEILAHASLPVNIHRQPEGIAIGTDGALYISDEGIKHGILVRYQPIKSTGKH